MKLSDLYLDRFLYRDSDQDSETKDASFLSGDSSEVEPASIPSGGAAQDINTGNVEVDGAIIEPGSIPSTTLVIRVSVFPPFLGLPEKISTFILTPGLQQNPVYREVFQKKLSGP